MSDASPRPRVAAPTDAPDAAPAAADAAEKPPPSPQRRAAAAHSHAWRAINDALNVFRTVVHDDRDAHALAVAWRKSLAFYAVFLALAVALVVVFALRTSTYVVVFAASREAVEFHAARGQPSCRCSRTVTYAALDMLHPRSSMDFSRNACGAVRTLAALLLAAGGLAGAANDTSSQEAQLLASLAFTPAQLADVARGAAGVGAYAGYLAAACEAYETGSQSDIRRFLARSPGALLLLPAEFERATSAAVVAALSATQRALGQNVLVSIAVFDGVGLHVAAGPLLAASLARAPPNCSCGFLAGGWGSASLAAAGSAEFGAFPFCSFTHSWSVGLKPFTCHVLRDAMTFPTSLLWDGDVLRRIGLGRALDSPLVRALLPAALNLTTPLTLPRPADVPARETVFDTVRSLIVDGFLTADAAARSDAGAGDFTIDDIEPSTVRIASAYDAYYSACAPSTCTYAQTATPDAASVVVALLGVLGGAALVVRLLIIFLHATVRQLFECKGDVVNADADAEKGQRHRAFGAGVAAGESVRVVDDFDEL